jgi:PAS domain S-box-containing protein
MPDTDPIPLQVFIDSLPLPIFFKDSEGRYLGCNSAFEACLGLSRDHILGRTPHDIAPSELAEIYQKKDLDLFDQRGSQIYEASLRYADGTLHDVVFHKATFQGENGAPKGLVGAIVDITERKLAEKRLRDELEIRRKLLTAVPIGVAAFHGVSGECLLCNAALADICGGTIDEILTQNFRRLASWRRAGMTDLAERTLADEEDQRLETQLMTTFGREIWASCVFTTFHVEDEKHLLILLSDATESHQAREALRKSEAQYRMLTEKMGEGLIATDTEGRFTYCNPKFLQMLGFTEEEILGKTFFESAYRYDYEKFRGRLQNRRAGAAEQYEIRLAHKDGNPVDVLVSAEPLFGDEGQFTGTLGIITDIRERKRNEEMLRRAQKVESLTMLAAGIAHDFNNLFHTIQGNLEMAEELISDPARTLRALERALQSLDQASKLSQKMLDYSGKSSWKAAPVDFASLVRNHAVLLSDLAGGAGLRFEIESGLPPIEGDPEQLLQVLSSLITNARESMEGRKGTMSLHIEALSAEERGRGYWVEAPPAGETLAVAVSDSGCGIPPETLSKLFDPFFTTKEPGRGLGLASTLGILKGHSAGLQVLSETGKGTTFRMAFPLGSSSSEPVEPAVTEVPLAAQFVLLVDDDDSVRRTASEILKDLLHRQVIEARDGKEAVAVFQQHAETISVILMDATMPYLSGAEAFEAIKAIRPGTRAILCSGYSDDMGNEIVKTHGFVGFLKKPYSIKDLKHMLEKAHSS